MKIFINNQHIELPSDEMTVAELIAWRNIPMGGTAITINDRIVRKSDRESTRLSDGDRVVVISAAFGG